MKKYFFIGIGLILSFAVLLVIYGAYLNYTDEKKISERLKSGQIEVHAAHAEIKTIYPVINLDAARFSASNMADAIALVGGNIIDWNVRKNDHVEEGDLLVTLRNEQIMLKIEQAESALKRAEASLAQATNAYNRQGRLMAKNATSKEKYEEAEAQFNAANAAVSESRALLKQAKIDAEHLKITSPVSGEVLILYKNEGAYLQAGSPVCLIGNFATLRFSMTVNDSIMKSFNLNDKATIKFSEKALKKAYDTEYSPGNRSFENIEATLIEITPPPEEPATMRRIIWEVDNSAKVLEPLTYNNISIVNKHPYRALTIPLNARAEVKNFVYVANEDGEIEKREVETGVSDGKYIEIIKGLKENEIVVVENFEGLKDGMKVDIRIK